MAGMRDSRGTRCGRTERSPRLQSASHPAATQVPTGRREPAPTAPSQIAIARSLAVSLSGPCCTTRRPFRPPLLSMRTAQRQADAADPPRTTWPPLAGPARAAAVVPVTEAFAELDRGVTRVTARLPEPAIGSPARGRSRSGTVSAIRELAGGLVEGLTAGLAEDSGEGRVDTLTAWRAEGVDSTTGTSAPGTARDGTVSRA